MNNPVNYIDPTGNEKDTLGERYRQQEIDNYVANKRAGLDTGDVPPEIVAQGNAAIKALEAIDKQFGYSKQNPATGETNRLANRVDAPQADVPSASSKMEAGSGTSASKQAGGFSPHGYNPKPGERTFNGYVRNNVPTDVETKLYTHSSGFNTSTKNIDG